MSYTSTNLGSTPPGNITGNTLTTEQYRAAQMGLILQILDNLDHSSGKGAAVKRLQSGLDASKPAGGLAAGTVYVATDTGIVYYDDGTDLDVLTTLDNAQTWTAAQTFSSAASLDLSAASDTAGLKLPSKAGAAPTADGFLAFDTTLHAPVFGLNGATAPPGLWRIASTTLGAPATNITFSSIPGTFAHLQLEIQARGDGAVTVDEVQLQFNADGGANYDFNNVHGANITAGAGSTAGATSGKCGSMPGASVTRAAIAGAGRISVPNYAGTTFEKSYHAETAMADSTVANNWVAVYGGSWRSTAAITSVKLFPVTSTNFVTGTRITLYGLN